MIFFGMPWWFALLPLPWIVWRWLKRPRALRGTPQAALWHTQTTLLASLTAQSTSGRHLPWAWLLGCTLLIAALTRPLWVSGPGTIPKVHNVMFAIDVSGSMRTEDLMLDGKLRSRFDVVKAQVERFLAQGRAIRVGAVLFGDDAVTYLPMTTDLPMADKVVGELGPGIAGEGTALGDAIALAVERLRVVPERSRALILLTDGAANSGHIEPETAAEFARAQHVRIHAIGVGTDGTARFPRGPVLAPLYTEMPLDEGVLQRIAEMTGGSYARATDAEALTRIVAAIETQERSIAPIAAPPRAREAFWLPLLGGLTLLLWHARRTRTEIVP